MGLPWVRLDTNIAGNDKIADLLADSTASMSSRWQAAFSYVCSLGYSGGHETDGLIKFSVLGEVKGSKHTAKLCVKHFLWAPHPLGWLIVNYEKHQQLTAKTQQIKSAQRAGALKANCVRWHGADCKCWESAA